MTNQRRRSSDMRSTDGSPAEIPIAEPSRTDAPLTPAYDSSTPLRADATDADIKSRVAAVRFMDMDYRSVALAVARELASAVSADKDAELRSFRLHVLHCHEDDCDVCMGIADVGPLAEQEALALDGLTLMEKAAKCVSMLAKMNAPKDLPVSALPSSPTAPPLFDQVRHNAERDPTYCPYCLRCSGLVRMRKVETMYWRCAKCGAEHDLRSSSLPASAEQPNA